MGRYKPDLKVAGPDWDPDEYAVLKGSYSFMELQRVAFRLATLSALPAPKAEEDLADHALALAAAIAEIYRDVVLRRPGTPYAEGIERPRFNATPEALVEQPMDTTLSWLVARGIEHVRPLLAPEPAPITPAAEEAGLTAESFPAGGAGESRAHGAGVLRAGTDQP